MSWKFFRFFWNVAFCAIFSITLAQVFFTDIDHRMGLLVMSVGEVIVWARGFVVVSSVLGTDEQA